MRDRATFTESNFARQETDRRSQEKIAGKETTGLHLLMETVGMPLQTALMVPQKFECIRLVRKMWCVCQVLLTQFKGFKRNNAVFAHYLCSIYREACLSLHTLLNKHSLKELSPYKYFSINAVLSFC